MREFVFPSEALGENQSIIDSDSRRPSPGRLLFRHMVAKMPAGVRQNLQLLKEFPHLYYPVKINNKELDKSAVFAAHNSAELWYLRHHGDEQAFLGEFLTTVKAEPYCTVFDIGGYIGYWSVFAALQPGVRKVYTFEPNPITRNHLIHNLRINNVEDKIDVFDEAIADIGGQKTLYFNEPVDGASSLAQNDRHFRTPIPGISLDQFCLKMRARPDIIKVDVEGAEGLVFKGMNQLLQSNRRPRHIFLELHPRFLEDYFQTSPAEVIGDLTQNNYQAVSVRSRYNGTYQCHFALESING